MISPERVRASATSREHDERRTSAMKGRPDLGPGARADAASGDLRCASCGYGIAARPVLPDHCPMCGAFAWEPLGHSQRTAYDP